MKYNCYYRVVMKFDPTLGVHVEYSYYLTYSFNKFDFTEIVNGYMPTFLKSLQDHLDRDPDKSPRWKKPTETNVNFTYELLAQVENDK